MRRSEWDLNMQTSNLNCPSELKKYNGTTRNPVEGLTSCIRELKVLEDSNLTVYNPDILLAEISYGMDDPTPVGAIQVIDIAFPRRPLPLLLLRINKMPSFSSWRIWYWSVAFTLCQSSYCKGIVPLNSYVQYWNVGTIGPTNQWSSNL